MNDVKKRSTTPTMMTPTLEDLTPAAAKAILSVRFSKADLQRIHQLSDATKRGTITHQQREALELHLQLGHFLTLMHSKARMALRRNRGKLRRKNA